MTPSEQKGLESGERQVPPRRQGPAPPRSPPAHDPPPGPPPDPGKEPDSPAPPEHDPPVYPEHDARSASGSSGNQAERIQRQLDEALADSFPASDPVSIVTSQAEEDWAS
jgi:hypothetical protein